MVLGISGVLRNAKRRSYQWITSPPKPWFSALNYDDTYSPQYWWHMIFGRWFVLGDFWFFAWYISPKNYIILHQIPTRRLVEIRCSKIVSGCFLSGFWRRPPCRLKGDCHMFRPPWALWMSNKSSEAEIPMKHNMIAANRYNYLCDIWTSRSFIYVFTSKIILYIYV